MWKRRILRAGWTGSILALLVLEGGLYLLGSAQGPVSDTSSSAITSRHDEPQGISVENQAQPTPTYVSELAPAVVQAPQEPAALPASGARREAGMPWPKLAGFALALLGAASVYAARKLGGHEPR